MDENYNIYKKTVLVFTIVTFFEALITKHENGYEFIAIIPLAYFVCFMLSKNFHKYSRQYNGLLILNGLMFLKYVVTVFVVCITGGYKLNSYYVVSISTSSYYWATIILVGELISIFLVVRMIKRELNSCSSIRI